MRETFFRELTRLRGGEGKTFQAKLNKLFVIFAATWWIVMFAYNSSGRGSLKNFSIPIQPLVPLGFILYKLYILELILPMDNKQHGGGARLPQL